VAILSLAPSLTPAPLYAPTPKAAKRVLEFFTAQINNDHTRLAYPNATRRFAEWCEAMGLAQLADIQPVHVAAFVNGYKTGSTSAASGKSAYASWARSA
jgi:site-specific recombinase XerD